MQINQFKNYDIISTYTLYFAGRDVVSFGRDFSNANGAKRVPGLKVFKNFGM